MNCFNGMMSHRQCDCRKEMEDCRKHDEGFMYPTEYSEREKFVKETKVITTWHKEPSECHCGRGYRD